MILLLAGSGFIVYYVFFDLVNLARSGRDAVASISIDAEEEFEPVRVEWIPKVPETQMNILLLGLDNSGMCDAIMLVTYNMDTYDSALISIKRDTFVSNQTWAAKDLGQDHLAWANYRGMGLDSDFHAGAHLTAYTVEKLLDIDLHAYASITYDGFIEMVDLIGGVEIDVPTEFAQIDGDKLPAGLQRLDGEQALIFARHRQNPRIPEPGSTSEDGDRVQRNQRLIKALLGQCKRLGSDELMHIVSQLDDNMHTSMEDWDMLDLINVLYNRDPEDFQTAILPGEGELVYQDKINSDVYYFKLDFEKSDLLLQELGVK